MKTVRVPVAASKPLWGLTLNASSVDALAKEAMGISTLRLEFLSNNFVAPGTSRARAGGDNNTVVMTTGPRLQHPHPFSTLSVTLYCYIGPVTTAAPFAARTEHLTIGPSRTSGSEDGCARRPRWFDPGLTRFARWKQLNKSRFGRTTQV